MSKTSLGIWVGGKAGTFNDLPNLNQINCLRKMIFILRENIQMIFV